MDRYDGRETWTKAILQAIGLIEQNLDLNALNDLGEVSSRVIGRQKCELRSTGRRNLGYSAMQ
jgi:hypothetical protein